MGARGRNREGTGTGFCQAQFSENGTAFEEKKNYIYIFFSTDVVCQKIASICQSCFTKALHSLSGVGEQERCSQQTAAQTDGPGVLLTVLPNVSQQGEVLQVPTDTKVSS